MPLGPCVLCHAKRSLRAIHCLLFHKLPQSSTIRGEFMATPQLISELRSIAATMAANDGAGPWSTGERIAGAFSNGRMDWLPERYDHPWMLWYA